MVEARLSQNNNSLFTDNNVGHPKIRTELTIEASSLKSTESNTPTPTLYTLQYVVDV